MKAIYTDMRKQPKSIVNQRVKWFLSVVLLGFLVFGANSCSSDDENGDNTNAPPTDQEMISSENEQMISSFDDPVVKNYIAGIRILRLISVDPKEWPGVISKAPAAQWVKYLMEIVKDPNRVKEGFPVVLLLNPPSEKVFKNWTDSLLVTPDKYFPPLSKAVESLGYTAPESWTTAHEHTLLAIIQRGLNLKSGKMELYEIDQIDPSLLPPSEIRSIVYYYKGLIYLEHGYRYKAAAEFDKGMDWASHEDLEWSGLLDNGIYFRQVDDMQEAGEIDLIMTGLMLRAYAQVGIPHKREMALTDLKKYIDHSATKTNFTALDMLAYLAFEFEKGAIEKGKASFLEWQKGTDIRLQMSGMTPLSGLVEKSKSVNDLVKYGVFSYITYLVLQDWIGQELGVEGNPWPKAYEELLKWYDTEVKALFPEE